MNVQAENVSTDVNTMNLKMREYFSDSEGECQPNLNGGMCSRLNYINGMISYY